MNISSIFNSLYSNSTYATTNIQKTDAVSSASKTQNIQKPDAISSATKKSGGDHYFEARA
ncbi:hypothetical protein [Clostridium hydrogenum]|uniref:hypothetical protein n=1 Tax=Clostridium hydrogenum TaxID=2855764 RepID=UPI001F3827C4|nr:hypothetical protein [Clostridium hydrogenum]